MNHDQPPSFTCATPLRVTRKSRHRRRSVARFSELLGKPLIPWQCQVIDVISEIDPSTGTYWYDELVLTVQPQVAGPSPKATTCANRLGAGPQDLDLAQTGKDANHQFRDFVKSWRKSRLRKLAKPPRLKQRQHGLGVQERQPAEAGGATEVAGHGVEGQLDQCGPGMEPVKTTGEEPQGRFHPHYHHA